MLTSSLPYLSYGVNALKLTVYGQQNFFNQKSSDITMWILIAVGILVIILGIVALYAMKKGNTHLDPMSVGMAAGGIVGAVIGILLVEFAGFEYPFPAILWMLGMAAGQIIGLIYKKKFRQ